jgi:hypothetical protein
MSALLLSSCASKGITVYPIKTTDIVIGEDGSVCMSEFYFNEVMQLKLKEM